MCDFPVKLILDERIIFSKTGSAIIALRDYEEGNYVWRFPESNNRNPEGINPSLAIHEDRQREYEELVKKLFDKLEEYPAYAGRKFSILPPDIDENGHIINLCFEFFENTISRINNRINLKDSIDESAFSHGHRFHPPLQEHWVSDHGIPYFYVPAEGVLNCKTIILMHGGPEGPYEGDFSKIIKIFTQDGWAVIIPQESNRTGHGWEHFSKGFGEVGGKNLHQLLHVFQDAVSKSFIIDMNQIHLYGHSYGGFVATSFALRWNELHAGAGLAREFNLRSIIADAAFLDLALQDKRFCRAAYVGAENPVEFNQKYMPLHTIDSPLSALLTLIQGTCDVRCSAETTRQFSTALNAKGYAHKLLWHIGGHSLKHDLYPAFLLAHMNGASTSEIEKDLFLS